MKDPKAVDLTDEDAEMARRLQEQYDMEEQQQKEKQKKKDEEFARSLSKSNLKPTYDERETLGHDTYPHRHQVFADKQLYVMQLTSSIA